MAGIRMERRSTKNSRNAAVESKEPMRARSLLKKSDSHLQIGLARGERVSRPSVAVGAVPAVREIS